MYTDMKEVHLLSREFRNFGQRLDHVPLRNAAHRVDEVVHHGYPVLHDGRPDRRLVLRGETQRLGPVELLDRLRLRVGPHEGEQLVVGRGEVGFSPPGEQGAAQVARAARDEDPVGGGGGHFSSKCVEFSLVPYPICCEASIICFRGTTSVEFIFLSSSEVENQVG